MLKRAMGGRSKGVHITNGGLSGWGGISSGGFFGHYTSETYASAYPSIRAISADYMQVMPFAIDANGKPVDHEVIDALYHPNQTDSVVAFAEKIAVSTLARPKTYLLVWRKDGRTARPGGNFRKDKIAGFTFLERPSIDRRDGRTTYKVGEDTYSDQEVLVLPGGVDPGNLYAGYSPSEAARRWVKLDDYMADYQAGFFENGAVPAGLFTVTAATTEDYDDAVDQLERKHRGAGKNGNVAYAHKLINDTGGTVATSVEWTPFAQSNKDIDFAALFEQTDKRINTAYGVPASVKGDDANAKYDNAEVGEATFAKRAVKPLLLRNYTQITHELNRITGGLGVAIHFKYDIPAVSDAEKVKAQTKTLEGDIIIKYTSEPYNWSLDSVVDAFDLPNRYKLLKKGNDDTIIVNDKPEVDEGGEVIGAPDRDIVGGAYYVRSMKAVAARQFEDELDDLLPKDTGYIMLDTEKIEVLSLVDDAESDLVDPDDTQFGNVPGETTPHITLLDGVLNQPSEIKELVDKLYKATPVETFTIEEVSMFELEDSNAIIAKIKLTDELKELRENMDLVPHASKFSVYIPHITLAYITKEADSDKWIESLNDEYAGLNINVTSLNLGEERTEEAKSTNPKAPNGTKQLTNDDLVPYQEQVDEVVLAMMQRQIDRTIDQTKAVGDVTVEDHEDLTEEILAIMLLLLLASGQSEYATGLNILTVNSIPLTGTSQYILSDITVAEYKTYLTELVQSYNLQTQASIQSVLAAAQANEWSTAKLHEELRNIINTDAYRATRLSLSESHRVMQIASIAAIAQLMAETSTKFNKVWRTTSGNACQYCATLDGRVMETAESFLPVGEALTAPDGAMMINTFLSVEHPPLHPNCACILSWEVQE